MCFFGTRFPRSCNLLMDAVVNFGCTAASSQVIARHHSVTNQGSLPGNVHAKQCSYFYDQNSSEQLIQSRIDLLKLHIEVISFL